MVIDTLNGDPRGLKREQLSTALQDALPSLAPCLGPTEPPIVGLTFDASGDGTAQNIKITGASPQAERCVSRALARVKLPLFEGKSVPVQFPLSVYRPALPPVPAPAPPVAAAAGRPSEPAPSAYSGTPPAVAPRPGASSGPYVPPSMPTRPVSTGEGSHFIQP